MPKAEKCIPNIEVIYNAFVIINLYSILVLCVFSFSSFLLRDCRYKRRLKQARITNPRQLGEPNILSLVPEGRLYGSKLKFNNE